MQNILVVPLWQSPCGRNSTHGQLARPFACTSFTGALLLVRCSLNSFFSDQTMPWLARNEVLPHHGYCLRLQLTSGNSCLHAAAHMVQIKSLLNGVASLVSSIVFCASRVMPAWTVQLMCRSIWNSLTHHSISMRWSATSWRVPVFSKDIPHTIVSCPLHNLVFQGSWD